MSVVFSFFLLLVWFSTEWWSRDKDCWRKMKEKENGRKKLWEKFSNLDVYPGSFIHFPFKHPKKLYNSKIEFEKTWLIISHHHRSRKSWPWNNNNNREMLGTAKRPDLTGNEWIPVLNMKGRPSNWHRYIFWPCSRSFSWRES